MKMPKDTLTAQRPLKFRKCTANQNRINKNKEIVLAVLQEFKELKSIEIVEKTGLSQKAVNQLLRRLRDAGKIFSFRPPEPYAVNIWGITEFGVEPNIKPLPNLDEEHENWVKLVNSKKVTYNPWGKPCQS